MAISIASWSLSCLVSWKLDVLAYRRGLASSWLRRCVLESCRIGARLWLVARPEMDQLRVTSQSRDPPHLAPLARALLDTTEPPHSNLRMQHDLANPPRPSAHASSGAGPERPRLGRAPSSRHQDRAKRKLDQKARDLNADFVNEDDLVVFQRVSTSRDCDPCRPRLGS